MKAGIIPTLSLAAGLLLGGQATADQASAQRLLQAAGAGDLASVDALLKQGVAVDVRDGQGNTPLLLATAANRVEVARRLVDAGADVNLQNRMQDSAYLLAGARGYREIAVQPTNELGIFTQGSISKRFLPVTPAAAVEVLLCRNASPTNEGHDFVIEAVAGCTQ